MSLLLLLAPLLLPFAMVALKGGVSILKNVRARRQERIARRRRSP